MSREDALDYVFDNGEIPQQVTTGICRRIDEMGLEQARKTYVEQFTADIGCSGAEIFDEASSRC